MIEIDITSTSVRKFPLYAQVGVKEVWRYDGETLFMSKLSGDSYIDIEESTSLPGLTVRDLTEFLDRSRTTRRRELIQDFRKWLSR